MASHFAKYYGGTQASNTIGITMKLIIGLGNPGLEYDRTRHNAGFMVIDRLVRRHQLESPRSRFRGLLAEGHLAGKKCLLLKPITFMNRSGTSLIEALNFYKMDVDTELLILVDDLALPCGKIRLRQTGSPGGHNGLKDIQRVLGNSDHYARLRIGIDPPGRIAQVNYVLGKFTAAQWDEMQFSVDTACDAVEAWIANGIDHAMNLFNVKS